MDLIAQLKSNQNRGKVLVKLNNKRDTEENLAELLWHFPGTVAILLEGNLLNFRNCFSLSSFDAKKLNKRSI